MTKKNSSTSNFLIGLIFILVIIIVYFLGKQNFVSKGLNFSFNPLVFINKEYALRSRYLKYGSLIESGKFAEAYDFFSSDVKRKGSKEEYVSEMGDQPNKKQNIKINSITIKNNIGYIDRTNITCKDTDCKSTTTVKGYRKWIYENGNWYYSPPDPSCIRNEMYGMPPEFERALSLYKQRSIDSNIKWGMKEEDLSYLNCLSIQYGDLGESEGIFSFDQNSTSLDKLDIYVNHSYINNDDLLTAILLGHEIRHVINYLNKVSFGIEISCINNEVQAFYSELALMGAFNTEEFNSIKQRIINSDYGYSALNTSLQSARELLIINNNSQRICGLNNQQCYNDKTMTAIEQMVRNNPYYQKQCATN